MFNKKILFLGKKNDNNTFKAINYLNNFSKNVKFFLGDWGEKFPSEAKSWHGDIIISYNSRWLVPNYLLSEARELAINFHPGSPKYPGIGCLNFALYEQAHEYGVTCHHMKEKVDTGDIIKVTRFPIYKSDNIESLLLRTYDYQICLYYKIIDLYFNSGVFPKSTENWERKPFTRKEFDELNKLRLNMNKDELEKRIRATVFDKFRPSIVINDIEFRYDDENL